MTQRQTFPLKTQLPSLNSLEKFQLHVSVSKGFIWSCPIVRKNPIKKPVASTADILSQAGQAQSSGFCSFRMLLFPRKQDVRLTLAFCSSARGFSAQAVSSDTNPNTGSVLWHSLCHLGCPAAATARPHLKWGRAGAAQCRHPQLGVSVLQGWINSFRQSHWRKKTQSAGFWNRIWGFKAEQIQ